MATDPETERGSRLLRGVLDACLLALVAEQDRYGYELARTLHERGLTMVADSSIYPVLRRLEQRGALEAYRVATAGSGPPRRYYTITPLGRDQLASAIRTWSEVVVGVQAVLPADGVAVSPPSDPAR